MPAQATLEAKGLWTNVNALSGAPPGSTKKQVNMRVHKPGLMTPRRGRKSIFNLSSAFLRIFDAGSFLIAFAADLQVYYSTNDGVSWTQFTDWVGSVVNIRPAWGLQHFYSFGLNNSFFFNTDTGIKVVSTSSGGYRPAGVPYGLNCKVGSLVAPGTAIPPNSRVGYRVVFGIRNPTGQVELGAPSQRAIAINSSLTDTVNPLIEIVIPPGIVAGKHFWQLYRTYPSADATVDPGDDMSLVFEGEFNQQFTTDTLSRTNNIATIHSIQPHGLQAGDVVNLDTTYDPPPSTGTLDDLLNTQRPYSPTSAANCAFKREIKYANATPTVLMDDIPLGDVQRNLNYPSDSAAYWPVARWLRSDALNYTVFVHPQLTEVRVYKTGVAGLLYSIPTGGYTVDSAAISADGTKLYFITPTIQETDNRWTATTNYRFDSGLRFGIIDLVHRTLTWAPGSVPLPTPLADAQHLVAAYTSHQALMNSPCFVTKGIDGVERFVVGSINYNNAVAGTSRLALANYFVTTNLGQSWSSIYPTTAVSPETVEERYNTTTNLAPRYSFHFSRTTDNSGVVRAFPVHRGRAVNGIFMWAGSIRTIVPVPVPVGTSVAGVSVNPSDGRFSYVTQPNAPVGSIVYTIVRFNGGAYSVAAPLSTLFNSPRNSSVGADEHASYYDGPVYGAFFEETSIVPHRYIEFFPQQTNVPMNLVDNTLWSNEAGRGVTNYYDVVFYPGTYIVESVIDANTLTVSSHGPDFTVVPYSSIVNFNTISTVDNVAPGAVGPALYTSPSQEGIGQANFPPPFAKDIETFRSYGFYANATLQAYLPITLFSVGAEAIDLQLGDKVLIGNHVVIAAAVENFPASEFKLVTNTGSAYENIRQTMDSLSECVNLYADALHGCVLVKNEDTVSPGSFYIRSLYFDTNINFQVRRGVDPVFSNNPVAMNAWSPADITVSGPTQQPNVIYYSKPGQGGAVPLVNGVRVGSDNSPITRIKATREVLFVFKPEGIFAMRGYAPPWQVDPFDLSNNLMLPDALCQLDNNIFCATSHGIMKVSDSGIELISLPIQDIIERQYSTETGQLAYAADRAFMFGDPSDHKLHVMLPCDVGQDTRGNRMLVYDTYTNTWFDYGWNANFFPTEPTVSEVVYDNRVNHGLHYKKTNGCIFVNEVKVFTERKSYTNEDFVDDLVLTGGVTKLTGYLGNVVRIGNPTDFAQCYGGIVRDELGDTYRIVSQDFGNYSFILDRPYEGPDGTQADVYFDIWCDVLYNCTYEVNAAALNHFREVSVLFRSALFDCMNINFFQTADGNQSYNFGAVVKVNGSDSFAEEYEAIEHFQVRTLVPREQQRCSVLTIGFQIPTAFYPSEVEGAIILFNPGPMRRSR